MNTNIEFKQEILIMSEVRDQVNVISTSKINETKFNVFSTGIVKGVDKL